ncbi:MAG: hypothetical protein J5449_06800 [Oscillospiraceae bacterium]|nr:hypothetical protein [Oscillospiraceae bacterium]
MKPIFCNTINLTHNKNKTEIVLNFSHLYTEHNFTAKEGQLTDVSGQVVEPVASVLLSREGALALARLMNRVIENWGEDVE